MLWNLCELLASNTHAAKSHNLIMVGKVLLHVCFKVQTWYWHIIDRTRVKAKRTNEFFRIYLHTHLILKIRPSFFPHQLNKLILRLCDKNGSRTFECPENKACAGPQNPRCCSPVLGEVWVQGTRVSKDEGKAGVSPDASGRWGRCCGAARLWSPWSPCLSSNQLSPTPV